MAIAKTTHQRNAQMVAHYLNRYKSHPAVTYYLVEKIGKQAEYANDYQIKRDNVVQEAWCDQYQDTRDESNEWSNGNLCNHADKVL